MTLAVVLNYTLVALILLWGFVRLERLITTAREIRDRLK